MLSAYFVRFADYYWIRNFTTLRVSVVSCGSLAARWESR